MRFKNLLITSMMLAASSYALADSAIFLPKATRDKTIAAYFHKLLPTTTITSIYTTPYPDTYALVMGNNLVYGNTHSTYLTVGHMFNIYTKDDITANLQKTTAPKVDIKSINVADAVVEKSPNHSKKKLIVFVDPDCPYCRLLEHQLIDQKINQKADIYYMLMPLSIHPNSKAHTSNILCSTNQLATLKEYMLKGNDNPQVPLIPKCNIDLVLERTGSIARSFGIEGTPTIITGTGTLIMGDDIDAINGYLNSK